jgi:integrase
MARRIDYRTQIHKLSAPKVKALTKVGRHSDGGNLFVTVRPSGSKYFTFLFRDNGKTIECGIGSCDLVTLADARSKADEGRALLRDGRNPKTVWQDQRRTHGVPTFAEMADEHLTSASANWRSKRHLNQVRASLQQDCKLIAGKLVNEITSRDVQLLIEAVAKRAPKVARRLGGTIEQVLDRAQLRGFIAADKRNPAAGAVKLLGAAPKVEHHASMPYNEVGAFLERLNIQRQNADGSYHIPTLALAYLILTGTRRGETCGALWSEIDLPQRLWIIPAERMKADRDHHVPLNDSAVAILTIMAEQRCNEFVFPGSVPNAPVSGKSIERLLLRLGCKGKAVAHGFRTSIRGWAKTQPFSFETCEEALAHSVGNATSRAYDRQQAVEKLRVLFAAWDQYLTPKSDNVVQLRSA